MLNEKLISTVMITVEFNWVKIYLKISKKLICAIGYSDYYWFYFDIKLGVRLISSVSM